MNTNSPAKVKEAKYWDKYWEGDALHGKRFIYDVIASFYRRFLIRPSLNNFIKKYLKEGSNVLHAGCGGGEVDMDIKDYIDITALDFSRNALKKYRSRYGIKSKIVMGDVRSLPFKSRSFDGIYNLGVMEHFEKKQINVILKEFYRVLKPGGRLIIFWPPEFGVSVIFFKVLVFIGKDILRIKKISFHPLEISRLRSESEARRIFGHSGFRVIKYDFGVRDLFTYMVIVAQK